MNPTHDERIKALEHNLELLKRLHQRLLDIVDDLEADERE